MVNDALELFLYYVLVVTCQIFVDSRIFYKSSSTASLRENPSTILVARSPSTISEKDFSWTFPKLITPSPSKQQGTTVPSTRIAA